MDRCGCYNGSNWNGNSCIPGGVSCPPNALWNGTCYCEPAHWETGTHADVLANGACCPKHGYYEWGPVNSHWEVGTGRGTCRCLDGYHWNGTACIATTGWPMPIAMRLGIGGAIGGALLLTISAALGILLCKAAKGHGVKDQLPLPFTTLPNAASFFSRKNGRFLWCGGIHTQADKPSKWSATRLPSNVAPGLDVPSENIRSTTLDLLRGNHTLSNASGVSEGSPSDVVPTFVEEDAQTGGTDNGLRTHRGGASSQGGSGRTNLGGTFHSLWTRSKGSLKRGEILKTSHSGPSGASPGRLELVKLEVDHVGAKPDHEELWTRGVDPADVDILLDSHGQRVVLGRGAFAVLYLGRWQATLVAVKVMLATDSEAAQQEVQAEADILRGLRHPNVVLLMAVCISPGQQMMVSLEYCGGGNLQKALQRDERNKERRLGWYTAHGKQPGNGYRLAEDIARGLACLHHRQLIHFDIKPANVLLDHAWTHAKISDVGKANWPL